MSRYRITYAKTEELRYTGNLDLHKIWERTLRRARLPLAYSQGFHPQPRINQACPLPLGFLSRLEMLDIWLETELTPDDIICGLAYAGQPGLKIQKVEVVDPHEPSLPTQVQSADYHVWLLDDVDVSTLQAKVDALLAAENLPRTRRDKPYNLRPLVQQLVLLPRQPGEPPCLWMRLTTRESATGRPDEVAAELGYDPFATRIERLALSLR